MASSHKDENSGDRKHEQGNQLGESCNVADLRPSANTPEVDSREDSDQQGHNDEMRQRIFGLGPELREGDYEQVCIGGGGGEAGQPEHPSGLNSDELPEGLPGVEIWASSLAEL